MSWVPFFDQLSALTSIFNTVKDLVTSYLLNFVLLFTGLFILLIYPPVLIMASIYTLIALLYETVVASFNNIILVPNTIYLFTTVYMPSNMPKPWTILFMMMVTVNMWFTLARIYGAVYDLLPAYLGGK